MPACRCDGCEAVADPDLGDLCAPCAVHCPSPFELFATGAGPEERRMAWTVLVTLRWRQHVVYEQLRRDGHDEATIARLYCAVRAGHFASAIAIERECQSNTDAFRATR